MVSPQDGPQGESASAPLASEPADEHGFFGEYGGRFAAEMLMPALRELEKEYAKWKVDPEFRRDLDELYRDYSGRPTPLYFAKNLTEHLGGAKIYLKQEGLGATGAHKINHCLGQALLAQRMNKRRIICETGAGQHGLATATVAARFGIPCEVFMGAEDVDRQATNVFWMRTLGATVNPVEDGTRTLKDAVNAALKDWSDTVEHTYYLLGSALGPHPYPTIVRDFQEVIGREVRQQILEKEGRLPDLLVACVGGGSNSIGLFHDFLDAPVVRMIGVEAGGRGLQPGDHAARFAGGRVGVVEGYKSYFLQNEDGQVQPTHSICAGLDYAGIGPQHARLRDIGRVSYEPAMDDQVVEAFKLLAKKEGILSALESSHAVAWAVQNAGSMSKDEIMVVNLSGRGDKDIFLLAEAIGGSATSKWKEFCLKYAKGEIS